MLTVAQLVLLDREAQPIVVVVGHGELAGTGTAADMVTRLHHDRLAPVLIVRRGPVRVRMQRI